MPTNPGFGPNIYNEYISAIHPYHFPALGENPLIPVFFPERVNIIYSHWVCCF